MPSTPSSPPRGGEQISRRCRGCGSAIHTTSRVKLAAWMLWHYKRCAEPLALTLQCPCEQWQVDIAPECAELPAWMLRDLVEEALLEHQAECIVLAASHIAAEAVR